LFELGFSNDANKTTYIYIALEVFKEIGFEDKALLDWLNRDYNNFKLTIYNSDEQIWEAERKQLSEYEKVFREGGLGDIIDTWHDLQKQRENKEIIRFFYGNDAEGIIDIINRIHQSKFTRNLFNAPSLSFYRAQAPTVVNFPEMADNARNSIRGKSPSSYSQTLEKITYFIIRDNSRNIIRKEIENEFVTDYYSQYGEYDIEVARENLELLTARVSKINNDLIMTFIIISAIAAVLFCVYTLFTFDGYPESAGNVLAWLPLPFLGLFIFLIARNSQSIRPEISGYITAFVMIGLVIVIFVCKKKLLGRLGAYFYRMNMAVSGLISGKLRK
jgi:hypothetical protein